MESDSGIILKKGAEAVLVKGSYFGKKSLEKKRIPKKYRIPLLDKRLRKERTKKESMLLHKAKEAGVRTPLLYKIDRKDDAITMEFVEGNLLKEFLENKKNEKKDKLYFCRRFGRDIGRLHSAGIIHGDLTTSNVIVSLDSKKSKSKAFFLFDFGLGFSSSKQEDKAVDLIVLKKTYIATHLHFPEGWKSIISSYVNETGNEKIKAKIKEIESRARYS